MFLEGLTNDQILGLKEMIVQSDEMDQKVRPAGGLISEGCLAVDG